MTYYLYDPYPCDCEYLHNVPTLLKATTVVWIATMTTPIAVIVIRMAALRRQKQPQLQGS